MPWGPHNIAKARAARKRKTARDVLTDRERIVAQGIVGGMSQKAAFAKAGYAAGTNEMVVLTRPAVIRYIEELRERAVTRLDYTIENLCARLEHISYAALDAEEYAPAVSAIMGIAKMMGHLADRTEIEMHIISKPAREPTKEITLSPEEWQRQFAPKQIQ
jgi:mitochondrial fission protein ELM1